MKSTIKVELGHDNQPVIRMRVNPSDDVRDVLFQQFKETFGGESNLCSVTFDSAFIASDGVTCIMEISPIPKDPTDAIEQLSLEQQVALYQTLCKVLPAETKVYTTQSGDKVTLRLPIDDLQTARLIKQQGMVIVEPTLTTATGTTTLTS